MKSIELQGIELKKESIKSSAKKEQLAEEKEFKRQRELKLKSLHFFRKWIKN